MTGSLLALLDDIATVLDDVSVLSKVAAQKTSGVLGDDLALNAQQVAGVRADRELPVVAAVAKGSFVNKAILVPGALAISAFLPWAVTPLLMIGGAFLCYEGFEKVAHRMLNRHEEDEAREREVVRAISDPAVDMHTFEKERIRGAIRTDFVLSAEIIVITLGVVAGREFLTQVMVLTGIAVLMTVGVYGLVAGIVRLDDLGLYLSRRNASAAQLAGRVILRAAPWLMKALAVAGTVAMFLVGGGILVHGLPRLHHGIQQLTQDWPGAVSMLSSALLVSLCGVLAGAIVLAIVSIFRRAARRRATA